MPQIVNLANFRKSDAFGLTVLPDKSALIGQKMVENGIMNETFLVIFNYVYAWDFLVLFKLRDQGSGEDTDTSGIWSPREKKVADVLQVV